MSIWAKWLALGLLSVVFGILALGNAVAVSLAIVWVTGTLLLISGVVQIAAGAFDEGGGNKLLSIALGLLMAVLGISFMRNPLEGTMSLTLIITLLIGAGGVLRLIWAARMRETGYFWMMLLSGALSILLAAFIFANFQEASTQLLGILLGLEMLFNGAALVVLALFLRAHSNRG